MRKHWIYGADMTDAQWALLNAELGKRGWGPFVRETTRIFFCQDESNTLAGFGVVQFIAHAEPIWVAPEHRGTGLAEEIASEVVGFLDEAQVGFVATVDNPYSRKLCESHGMKLLDKPVYVKERPRE